MILSESQLNELVALIGAKHVLSAHEDVAIYAREPRDRYHALPAAVVSPANVAEVSALVRFAAHHNIVLVPQGGNTGLVGGQVPAEGESRAQIILNLRRLDRVREVDADSNVMILEAGVSLQRAQEIAAEAGRLFPLSLASQGSCTIGGNLATNAGGTGVIAYGMMRDLVLGVEAVMADGSVVNSLSKLRKDNTGYDLTQLLVGSEGTLGIITAASLKLFPCPSLMSTAYCAVASVADALKLLHHLQGDCRLTSFEFMPRIALDMLLRHQPQARDPFAAAHPWYVLVEAAGAGLENSLSAALESGLVRDVVVAQDEAQRKALWLLREEISWVQKREGGSIKHDVSVPIAAVPAFIAAADAAIAQMMPGARVVSFGHLGDGNVHYNISQPVGMVESDFLSRWDEVSARVHEIVLRFGGSIAAEHGIGQMKREALSRAKDPAALAQMSAIKRALDPQNILNPGKLVDF